MPYKVNPTTGQLDYYEVAEGGGGGVATNLNFFPSPTTGTVTSDSGTDADIPLADSTNSGLFSPSEKAKLAIALTSVGVDYRGAYNNGDGSYTYGSVVLYNGLLYEKISNPNNPGYPPTGTDWALFDPEIGSPSFDLWIRNILDNKVNTEAGKGLSTEDYTTAEQTKLAGIQAGAEVNVNADWNATSGDALILNKPTSLPSSFVKHAVKYGEALVKGQAAYVSSSDGTNMIVSKADYSLESTSSKTMGLIITSGATNFQGEILTEGLLAGTGSEPLSTISANAGDPVWLGDDGNLLFGLANKPVAPNHMVFIGIVTRVHAVNGEIFVKVQNGFELGELHNVDALNPNNNDGLFYNTSTSLWENKSIATALGYIPANKAGETFTGNISATNLSGTNTGDETTDTIKTKLGAASSTADGYLTSTNWSTFNAKQNAITLTTTGSSGSATLVNSTLNIPTYTLAGLGGINLSSLSASTPLSYNSGTGAFSIQVATTAQNGYLSSTDWNTFNNKGSGTVTSVAALTLGTTGTDISSSVATGTTTPVITLNIPTASATKRGALSSTDWSTFNNKQATLVSGTNIKTINGSSILGSGNLALFGGNYSGNTLTMIFGTPDTIGNFSLNTYTASAATAFRVYSADTTYYTPWLSYLLGNSGYVLQISESLTVYGLYLVTNVVLDSGNGWYEYTLSPIFTSGTFTFGNTSYISYTKISTIGSEVITKTLTGYSSTTGTISSSDTILTAINKLNGNIDTKQNILTLTTTGTSGAATLVGNTLNIPQYTSSGASEKSGSILSTTRSLPFRMATSITTYRSVSGVGSTTISSTTFAGESTHYFPISLKEGSPVRAAAFRVNTAGSGGLGTAEIEIGIYNATTNANGELIPGTLEVQFGKVSVLSTGVKEAVLASPYTLGATVDNIYWIAFRNYSTNSQSLNIYSSTDVLSSWVGISSSTSLVKLGMFVATTPYTAPTGLPASLPATGGVGFTQSTTVAGYVSNQLLIGIR